MNLETIVFWVIALAPFIWFIVKYVPLNLWYKATMSEVEIKLMDLVKMKFMNIPPKFIVDNMIIASQAGLKISVDEIQEHYLATGDVPNVIQALILAKKDNSNLTFRQAAAIDLAGSDILEAVKLSMIPHTLNMPNLTIRVKNETCLLVKVNITLKANIDQLVGGAREEVLLAKVENAIISEAEILDSYDDVLAKKDEIIKTVLAKKIDAGTAFKILKIEITDIEIQKNIKI